MEFLNRFPNEDTSSYFNRLAERSDREDLVMFINACFAATRQNDYYHSAHQQSVSIDFLHRYILANYRRLYARVLAAGINHFNKSWIIVNLLKAGAPANASQKREEGLLIQWTLESLPPQRVYKLFRQLKQKRVNNRRTRSVIKTYLANRNQLEFHAIKYRSKLRDAFAHSHANIDTEIGNFLFDFDRRQKFTAPLLKTYQEAFYSASAVYELPFSIAESLIQKHGIPRHTFLRKIEPKMTAAEKLRLQVSAKRSLSNKNQSLAVHFDLANAPLTKLATYVLSLSPQEQSSRGQELDSALQAAAIKSIMTSPLRLGRTVAIFDQSRSSIGSKAKRNRPLAIAIGMNYLLKQATSELKTIWTPNSAACKPEFDFQRSARGQTSIAEAMIQAYEWQPENILIVSDGYENDPPFAANQIVAAFEERIGKGNSPEVVHLNPVFDPMHFSPKPLGDAIATVGIRDAENLPTMLGFARFASGKSSLGELTQYLSHRVDSFLPMPEAAEEIDE